MTLRYKITVDLLEDLHSGSGMGGGELDALQANDRRGLPTIPWSHFKGVLRYQAEALRDLGGPVTDDQIHALFGWDANSDDASPRSGALSGHSLRFVTSQGPAAWSIVWAASGRERDSRLPDDDTLHSAQHVRAGMQFECEARIEGSDADLAALFERVLKRTCRLGSKRARGDGLVRLAWTKPEVATNAILPKRGPGQRRLRLLLRNLDPICLPVTGVPGNLIATECYIRGQVLFGALTRKALAGGNRQAAQLLLDRTTSVGNAYPIAPELDATAELARLNVLPIPLSVHTRKPGRATTASRAAPEAPSIPLPHWAAAPRIAHLWETGEVDRLADTAGDEGLKRPTDETFLCRLGDGAWRRYEPDIRVRMRNQTPDARNKGTQSLFSLEELAEETLFLAELRFDKDSAASDFATAFASALREGDWLKIGRGGRPVEVARSAWLDDPTEGTQSRGSDGDRFTLVLESDLIARGAGLGFETSLTAEILARLAGSKGLSTASIAQKQFSDTVEVRGFNIAGRLPRSAAIAIRRGSTVRFDGPAAAGLRTALMAKSALGERTWEGFGRFRVDPPLENTERKGKEVQSGPAESPLQVADDIGTRESIRESAWALFNEYKDLVKGGAGLGQWRALGDAARLAADEPDLRKRIEFRFQRIRARLGARLSESATTLAEKLIAFAQQEINARGPEQGIGLARLYVETFVLLAVNRHRGGERDKRAGEHG